MASSTSADNIMSLISGAESLLSSYYPSTTLDGVATLTWPSTVVIDGSTYTNLVTSTSTGSSASSNAASLTSAANAAAQTSASPAAGSSITASSATSTPSSSSSASSALPTDKRLGVGLGVGLGLVAVLILLGTVYFLMRRKRKTGSYLKHPPPDDDEVEAWRGGSGWGTSNNQTRVWSDKDRYAPIEQSAPHMAALGAPRTMLPAFVRDENRGSSSNGSGINSYQSTSNSGSFHTPHDSHAELSAVHSRQNSMERVPLASAAQQPTRNRPPTPLLHDTMAGGSSDSPVSPIDHSQNHQYDTVNPFTSPQDYETQYDPANPFVSPEEYNGYAGNYEPPIPARSPDRRHSPHVIYPSGPELSNFDFGLSQEQLRDLRNAGQHQHNTAYQGAAGDWR